MFYLLIIEIKKFLSFPYKFKFPVISVGNITTGGTGKTTLIKVLIEKYLSLNKKIVIVTSKAVQRDEAIMLQKNFPNIFIIKSKNEFEIAEFTEKINPDIAIIDDGFHCCNIKKNLEILVIDSCSPFDNQLVIPSGFLREPLRNIKRADIFFINNTSMINLKKRIKIENKIKKFKKPIFYMDYKIKKILNLNKETIPVEQLKNKKIVAFSGIGNPFGFFFLLLNTFPKKIYGIIFPDHFSYTYFDLQEIKNIFLKHKSDFLITTEKDVVKIEKKYFQDIPFYFLEIEPIIENKGMFDKILDKIL